MDALYKTQIQDIFNNYQYCYQVDVSPYLWRGDR